MTSTFTHFPSWNKGLFLSNLRSSIFKRYSMKMHKLTHVPTGNSLHDVSVIACSRWGHENSNLSSSALEEMIAFEGTDASKFCYCYKNYNHLKADWKQNTAIILSLPALKKKITQGKRHKLSILILHFENTDYKK